MRTLIAPSILSANFSKIGDEVLEMEKFDADLIHCDVMDGMFVPNITFGPKMIADIKKITNLPLDVHLMIVEPERFVDSFIDAGADYLTIHYEATNKIEETLKHIRERGVKSGLVISPDTEVYLIKDLLKFCDIVLIMSVYPGFGGQQFIEKSIDRLKELKELIVETKSTAIIEIDGGITFDNVKKIVDAGAQVIVAGNTIFSYDNKKAAIEKLRVNL